MRLDIENRDGFTIYNVKFTSLNDLYQYLRSNPKVNEDIFDEQASINNSVKFSGVPLKEATEYLISGYKVDLDNFIELNKKLNNVIIDTTDNRKLERGLYGGIGLSPLVAAGVPDCMLRYERNSKENIRTIYFSLSYSAYTKQEAIRNRGLIALYIIKALEQSGNIVNFRASEFSANGSEIVNIEVVLKKPGDIFLNIEKCYYPMVGREFLRRLLFRVLESMPVKSSWGFGYGCPLDIGDIREIFKLSKSDIIIPQPSDIGISGYNIYDDTISAIENLSLKDEFDIEKIKTLRKNNY